MPVPRGEVLGVLPADAPEIDPKPSTATWVTPGGTTIDLTEPPPPWESSDPLFAVSDARNFVDVPPNWELRWINPRLLESQGWRDWQPLMADDPRIKLKVDTLRSPDGNVRRGPGGDILAWMYRSWVEARERHYRQQTERLTASAPARQAEMRDDFKRGKYGPYLHLDSATHPTHTMGEGKTMRD